MHNDIRSAVNEQQFLKTVALPRSLFFSINSILVTLSNNDVFLFHFTTVFQMFEKKYINNFLWIFPQNICKILFI